MDMVYVFYEIITTFSAPTEWVSSAGFNISLPVYAQVHGEVEYNKKPFDVDLNFVFEDFMISDPDYKLFLPPIDIFCEGRKMGLRVPEVPDFFTYESESVFYYVPPEILEKPPLFVVSSRYEAYDYLQKVSRVEYVPFGKY